MAKINGLYPIIYNCFFRNNESSIDPCIPPVYAANLVTLRNLISLIYKSMICCHKKTIGICICRNPVYRFHYFTNCILTGSKHFIFCIRFITPGINLIMIDIYHLSARKYFSERRNF